MPDFRQGSQWLAYAAIAFIFHMAGEVQALGLVGCEGTEADALDFACYFELDLVAKMSACLSRRCAWG